MFGTVATPTPIPDPTAAPLLQALRQCLCEQTESTVLGPVCRCYVAWGANLPVQDGCMCVCDDTGHNGDAWVKLDSLEPDTVAAGGTGQLGWCPAGWMASVTLGIYRCVPTPEQDSVLPSDVITDISLALLSDMAAVWRVLGCCDALQDGVRVVTWAPIDAGGGCAGGALSIQIPLAGISACPP
jgi:hypothetical protein